MVGVLTRIEEEVISLRDSGLKWAEVSARVVAAHGDDYYSVPAVKRFYARGKSFAADANRYPGIVRGLRMSSRALTLLCKIGVADLSPADAIAKTSKRSLYSMAGVGRKTVKEIEWVLGGSLPE